MKKLLTLSLPLAVACSSTSPGETLSSTQLENGPFASSSQTLERAEAESRAVDLLGGTVISSKLDTERGLAVFEVDIKLPSGAVIEVTLDEATGQVVQLESKVGPFTDEVDPGADFISLSEALAVVANFSSSPIVAWELELDIGLQWVWEFELQDETKIKVDARSGTVVDTSGDDDPWDDGLSPSNEQVDPRVRATALSVVDGEIIKTESELEHGMRAWKFTVRTDVGAEVEVYVLADGQGLLRVRDDAGPFSYAVTPGEGWRTLDQALTDSGRDASTLSRYRLDRDDSGRFVYEFRFEAGDERTDIEIDAAL